MKRHIALMLMLAAGLTLAAVPALAGRGGGGNNSPTTSTIRIASVDGTTMAATTLSPTTKLGDTLTFATTVEPLAGWEYPMVAVSCYQDVNGDGAVDTNLLGPDIVYAELAHPDGTFTLGGYSSIWLQLGGGPATCRADLDAYGWKGGTESIRTLRSTDNWSAAG
jgi:hypothetical protein